MIHKLSFCEVHTVIIYKDTNNTECQRSYVVWYISVEYSHIRVTTAKAKPSQANLTGHFQSQISLNGLILARYPAHS